MKFNKSYEENKTWELNNGILENKSLSKKLIKPGEKVYLDIAFDIEQKEAGTFINYASVSDDSLQILEAPESYKKGSDLSE